MSILERLTIIFERVFDGKIDTAGITPESRLREDIGMNSISLLYMAMAVEEEFGIRFSNDDFADIGTVADVERIIEKNSRK